MSYLCHLEEGCIGKWGPHLVSGSKNRMRWFFFDCFLFICLFVSWLLQPLSVSVSLGFRRAYFSISTQRLHKVSHWSKRGGVDGIDQEANLNVNERQINEYPCSMPPQHGWVHKMNVYPDRSKNLSFSLTYAETVFIKTPFCSKMDRRALVLMPRFTSHLSLSFTV